MNPPILPLPPNRVRRAYTGGALLEEFDGAEVGEDGQQPEDWVASTVPAINPGLPEIPSEGLAHVEFNSPNPVPILSLLEQAPDYLLGAKHVARVGATLGFLVKLLDAAVPLPVQAHPTRSFARKHLHSPWGKFESYVILQTRQGIAPSLRIGFQHPPSKEEFRRMIVEQDLPAIEACFEPIPVSAGDVWVVPGGFPHAIGAGLFMVETMEPSDLVVRVEYARSGISIPPEARFMGRDVDFALKVFNYDRLSVEEATARFKVTPKVLRDDGTFREEILVGNPYTDCFRVKKYSIQEETVIPNHGEVGVFIVVGGTGKISAGSEEIAARQGTRFLIPAATEALTICPESGQELAIVAVTPGSVRI